MKQIYTIDTNEGILEAIYTYDNINDVTIYDVYIDNSYLGCVYSPHNEEDLLEQILNLY